jgi:hypothetical protein
VVLVVQVLCLVDVVCCVDDLLLDCFSLDDGLDRLVNVAVMCEQLLLHVDGDDLLVNVLVLMCRSNLL